jgi:L-asparaginase
MGNAENSGIFPWKGRLTTMKRLIVIFTGGTIGSRKQDEAINVHGAGSYELVNAYEHSTYYRKDVELTALQPLNLLSENITPQDWLTLAAAVHSIDQTAYDGIIITHGSDTLAYSAVLLGYLFAAASIPLVATASNYPLEDKRSNGLRNFAGAIDFAVEASLPGVFALYEDDRNRQLVYLATRLMQAASFTDQFSSPYNAAYGEMLNRRFLPHASPFNPAEDVLRQPAPEKFNWAPATLRLEDRVMYIKPYPGLNYAQYSFSHTKPQAIIHDLHHSGTACAAMDGPYSLPAFIRKCLEQGISVYICPIKDRSAAMYASTRSLLDAGAIVLEGISVEAALVKLMLAYGLYTDHKAAEAFVTGSSLYYERMEVYNEEDAGNGGE